LINKPFSSAGFASDEDVLHYFLFSVRQFNHSGYSSDGLLAQE